MILKEFAARCHPRKTFSPKPVSWLAPRPGWIKGNIDGSSCGSLGISASGGVFRTSDGVFLGAFATHNGIGNAFRAELIAAIIAIELASNKGWTSLWLEIDSELVIQAFRNAQIIPWNLKHRWNNTLFNLRNFRFYISHIFREGNYCTNALASFGLTQFGFTWWDLIPGFISHQIHCDRIGITYYMFSSFIG